MFTRVYSVLKLKRKKNQINEKIDVPMYLCVRIKLHEKWIYCNLVNFELILTIYTWNKCLRSVVKLVCSYIYDEFLKIKKKGIII